MVSDTILSGVAPTPTGARASVVWAGALAVVTALLAVWVARPPEPDVGLRGV